MREKPTNATIIHSYDMARGDIRSPRTTSLNTTRPSIIFLLGILILKELTARRFYKSFGVRGLSAEKRWIQLAPKWIQHWVFVT
jgi:hypothetical protein